MQIRKNVMRCVVFAGYLKEKSGQKLAGTAFLLWHPVEESAIHVLYVITARHVVENAKARGDDGRVWLRVNKKDGTAAWLPVDSNSWRHHIDDRVDVSAAAVRSSQFDMLHVHDHEAIPSSIVLTSKQIDELDVRAGEPLFFPGLFVRHHGDVANIPILRTGSIASMPNEMVRTKMGLANVFLAEIKSIGGHSGSPVFLYLTAEKQHELRTRQATGQLSPGRLTHKLLGLVHGHFPVRPDEFTATTSTYGPSGDSFLADDLNSGIAVIVPAEQILNLLNQSELVAERASMREVNRPPDDPVQI